MEKPPFFFDYQNSFQLLILLGAILAAIFVLISPFFIKPRERRKIYLILFVFSLGMNNLSNYMIDINLHLVYPIIPLLPLPLTLMIPVTCYFCLRTVLDDSFRISAPEKILISLILAELMFHLFLMVIYWLQKQLITENPSIVTKVFQLKEFIAIFITLGLSVDIILKFYSRSKRNISPTTKRWHLLAKYIFALSAVLVFSWTVSYLYGFFIDGFSRKVYYPIWCISSFVICFAGWNAIRRKETVGPDKSALTTIYNDRVLFAKLQQVMVSHKLYKQPKITLRELSDAAGISSVRITRLLKANDENFNSFVNLYRVEEAKGLLRQQDNLKYTMDFISEEAGFNSRASFFNIFKTATGKTPKQYRDEMIIPGLRGLSVK